MSYNISNWTTKRNQNLVIPLSKLYNLSLDLLNRGWQLTNPKIKQVNTNSLVIEIDSYGFQATGLLISQHLHVTTLYCHSEGSGTFYREILLPALRQSSGELKAILVWEGGDSISRLIVKDGKITEEDIEL